MAQHDVYIFGPRPDLSFVSIERGDWVVIKPNLVKESKETDPAEWRSVITSPELIRQMCEHVCTKLAGTGRVTICDAPQTDSSFARIAERLGLYQIALDCSDRFGVPVEVVDLRNEEWTNEDGIITKRKQLAGDPKGAIAFNLGQRSLFHGFRGEGRYYGADYDSGVVNSHHRGETQEYLICATPILADVFINMSKLKTHKKTGVTLSLKNLVGINADKNWLPHHTEGSPQNGGDEFPNLPLKRQIERAAVKMARNLALHVPVLGTLIAKQMRKTGTSVFGDGRNVIRSGNWYGNDTTWRMVLDLNRCLLYGNADGSLRSSDRKRYYCLVDGLIGMQGMGPMQGDPVNSGIVIGGTDPVAVDTVAARLMGFDWRKIPVLREAWRLSSLPLTDLIPEQIVIHAQSHGWGGPFSAFEQGSYFHFDPHFGWKGHIEWANR
ncbi:MAG: DUF362 domain-containing protein [Nitrospirota bacterium]